MAVISQLIPILVAKTHDGRIPWQMSDPATVHTRVGKNFVEIERELSESKQFIIWIKIRNSDGKIVDLEFFNSDTNEYMVLYNLFEIAKRQALKVDETLDDIVRTLNSI